MISALLPRSNSSISQQNSHQSQSSQLMLSGANVSCTHAVLQTSRISKVVEKDTNTNKLTLFAHQGKLVFTFSKASISPEMTVEERDKMVLPEIKTNEFLDLVTAAKWIKEARIKYQPDKTPKKNQTLMERNLLYVEYINKVITKLLVQGFSVDTVLSLVEKKRFFIRNTLREILNTSSQQWLKLANAHWNKIVQPTEKEMKNHEDLVAKITNVKSFPLNFFKMKTILFFVNHFYITNEIEMQKESLVNLICFKMKIDYRELMILLREIKSDKFNAIFTQEEKKNLHHIESLHALAEQKRFDKIPLILDTGIEQEASEPVSKRARVELNDVNQVDPDFFTLEDITYITIEAACDLISQAASQLPTAIKNDFFAKLTTKLIKQGMRSDEIKDHLAVYGYSIYKTVEEIAKNELTQIATKLNVNISDLVCFDTLAYYRVTTILNLLLEGKSAQCICKLMALFQSDYEACLKNTTSFIPLLNENQKDMLSQTVAQLEDQAVCAPRLQFDTPFSEQAIASPASSQNNAGFSNFLNFLESNSLAELEQFDEVLNCSQPDTQSVKKLQFNAQQPDIERLDFPLAIQFDAQQLKVEQLNYPLGELVDAQQFSVEQFDFAWAEQFFNAQQPSAESLSVQEAASAELEAEESITLDLRALDQYNCAGFSNFPDSLESHSTINLEQLNEILKGTVD